MGFGLKHNKTKVFSGDIVLSCKFETLNAPPPKSMIQRPLSKWHHPLLFSASLYSKVSKPFPAT